MRILVFDIGWKLITNASLPSPVVVIHFLNALPTSRNVYHHFSVNDQFGDQCRNAHHLVLYRYNI
jgi:hypothetical protein